uniref:BTB domain-containing protein n=1 Tax=Oreochromis aureus TaxID=47969 RepID=A0AAZ1X7T0_OREAU
MRRSGASGRESGTHVDNGGINESSKTILQTPKHIPDSKAQETPHGLSSCLSENSGLISYNFSSHSDRLFTHLHNLCKEELLLDCTFIIQGKSFQAHRLVLAAISQTPNAFLGSKEMPGLGVEETAQCLTPVGLRAIMEFAYCGHVAMDLSKERVIEEVLNASQCLQMERLKESCISKIKTSAAKEREKSLAIIKDMWKRGEGCDVTIQAETGEKYSGCCMSHRVVLAAAGDYFRALLCGGLRESCQEVVCLRGVSSWVIESMLYFIYNGQLRLNWSRIWELTDAMLQFQLEGALSLCIEFLQDRMDESTCLDVLVLADTYGLVQLGQAAEEYIAAHFQCVSYGEKFKDIPFHLLDKLLKKDSLSVESEVVFLFLMASHSFCVYPGARITLVSLQSLIVLVLVGGDTVDDEFMKRVPSQTLWFAQQFHRGPGLRRSIEWKPFAKFPEPARFRHCVCLLNKKLYVLGGRKYYGHNPISLRFDLTQCKWEQLPDMLHQRDYFSALCLDGKVFALGGNHNDHQYHDAVEYYSPEENTWRLAHPLDTAVCGHAAAVLDGQIYISGGSDSHHHCLSSMWRYHPSRGCFPRSPMTVGAGRAGHTMLALGRRLVVAGGLQPLWIGFGDQLLCELYDPTQDSWSSFPTLPRAHLSPGGTVLDGKLYVVGGSSANTARDTKWVHYYNPKEQCWENLGAMPYPYTDLAACSLPCPDVQILILIPSMNHKGS